jgi:glutamine synthetase
MLMAGLTGIREKSPLPEAVEENIYKMSNSRQKKFDIRVLPRNLGEAVRLMEKSGLMRETLGEHIFSRFVANKHAEIKEYDTNVSGEFEKQVSDYEVKKYLPFL